MTDIGCAIVNTKLLDGFMISIGLTDWQATISPPMIGSETETESKYPPQLMT